MNPHKEEYRRKLPHIQPEQTVYFVTFNLKGALPKHITANLSKQYTSVSKNQLVNAKLKIMHAMTTLNK